MPFPAIAVPRAAQRGVRRHMETKALCQALLKEACEENVAFYRRMINEESLEAVKDEHWRRVITLARSSRRSGVMFKWRAAARRTTRR